MVRPNDCGLARFQDPWTSVLRQNNDSSHRIHLCQASLQETHRSFEEFPSVVILAARFQVLCLAVLVACACSACNACSACKASGSLRIRNKQTSKQTNQDQELSWLCIIQFPARIRFGRQSPTCRWKTVLRFGRKYRLRLNLAAGSGT